MFKNFNGQLSIECDKIIKEYENGQITENLLERLDKLEGAYNVGTGETLVVIKETAEEIKKEKGIITKKILERDGLMVTGKMGVILKKTKTRLKMIVNAIKN